MMKQGEVVVSDECKAVLAQQAQMAGLQQRLESMQAALARQQEEMARLKAQLPDLAALDRAHDDLLANHAIGEVTAEALAAHQARVSAARQAAGKITTELAAAERTAAALTGKCEELTAGLAECRAEKTHLIRHFLRAEAEKEAAQYVAAARQVQERYLRLRALDEMVCAYGGKYIREAGLDLCVPDFKLEACQIQAKPPYMRGALIGFDSRFDRPKIQATVPQERRALSEAFGIDFDAAH